jgi:rhodanese-related sulfurtransferase
MAVPVLLAALGGLVATSGAQTRDTQKVPVEGGGSYTDVSVRALARQLETKDFPLINVHIPYEGEIAGTDAFIPFNQIEASVGKLPADKGAKIVLYCRSGSMSAIAARALVKLGYTDVWNLDGGMIGWKEAGLPLVQKAR